MRWIRPLLTVLLVTVWLPATGEKVAGCAICWVWECPEADADELESGEESAARGASKGKAGPGDCGGCPAVAHPDLIARLAARSGAAPKSCVPLAGVPFHATAAERLGQPQGALAPPEVAASWQFHHRTASSPRAPTV